MGIYDGRLKGPMDDASIVHDAATLEATGDGTVVDQGVGFAPAPEKAVAVQGAVSAVKTSVGNETYTFALHESGDGTNYTATGLSFTLAATGTFRKVIGVTKRYLKLVHTLAGTLPSITLNCWISPP